MKGWWIRLGKYSLPHMRTLGLIGVLMLVSIGLEALGPWPLKVLVDHVLGDEEIPEVLSRVVNILGGKGPGVIVAWIAGATVLIYLLHQGTQTLKAYLEAGVGVRMAMDLGADLFDRLQRFSLRFHGRQLAGDLLRRVTHDTGCVRQLVLDVAFPMVQAVGSLVVFFVVMWNMDKSLAVLAIMVAPFLGLLIKVFARPMTERTYEQQNMEGQLMAMAERALTALPVVQAYGREADEESRFREVSLKTLRAYLRAVSSQLEFKVGVGGVMAVGTAVIMGIGGIHVVRESLTVGGLIVFLTYLGSLYGPMTTLAYLTQGFAAAKGGARRVLEIMDQGEEIVEVPGSKPLPKVKGKGREVRFESVVAGYEPGRPVLNGVSLVAEPGQSVAIVGPTGAGKSTLVSLIPRLLDPWEGRITMDGRDIKGISLDSLRSQISIVLQDPFLLPLSVAENIAYGRPGATLKEIQDVARAAGAHEFIERLPEGYNTLLHEGAVNLSGGEKQRIAIARALLRDSPILILDEPTSSLDPDAEAHIIKALDRLIEGRTTFIIAHRLSTIQKAHLVIVMDEGRIVEQGTHEELLKKGGHYARLHELQFGPKKEVLMAF